MYLKLLFTTMADQLKVWLDGEFMPMEEAKVPIMTHSLQYGSGIFEGIRSYETRKGTAIFRLDEHVKRFLRTAKIYSMKLQATADEIREAIIETVRINRLKSCYIRPFAFYNSDEIGLHTGNKKVSVFIGAVPFGSYFGESRATGVRCKVSSWRRINSAILPIQAKASGNYTNSIIASNEAKAAGYDEAILTSQNGHIAEGPGQNIFMVHDGKLITPNKDSDILLGITRDSLIKIAIANNIDVIERFVHREELYTADELFFAGTAAEITPIVSVDNIQIGDGKVGPLTNSLFEKFSAVVHGTNTYFSEWLEEIEL